MTGASTWILLLILIVVTAIPLARAFMMRRNGAAPVARADWILLLLYGVAALLVLAYWTVLSAPKLPELSSPLAPVPEEAGGSEEPSVSLPRACAEVRTSLSQLVELSQGTIRQERAGELLILDGLWEQIPSAQHTEVINVVARAAACPDGDHRDVVVTIREITSGRVVFQGRPSDR